jgi:hypothetical protein
MKNKLQEIDCTKSATPMRPWKTTNKACIYNKIMNILDFPPILKRYLDGWPALNMGKNNPPDKR